ncbi:MAG: lysine 2,3-aminomutase YodO family protein [Alphaproteobacteria bacterium]|jgi:lysine 2,3-aminomutase|nr:lysine 2,3-aminomutase YodO family protein [Alphaproteobacteria bacterium]MDB5740136.1 lysine 2,3-aminomutase YodO family protein [Alphaproteobacteria bacterium]
MSLDDVARKYAVAVSPHLLSLVNPADPDDPIARQFLPSLEELITLPHELADPIGDAAHTPVPGIVHRHTDRVLFKVVASCPVYCRFCFRREMIGPGKENALSNDAFEAALDYIAAHPEIWEVILTGGDPFILSPRRVAEVTARLAAIDHVKIIRWHTRVPVVDPARVTDALVAALHAPGATTWVAVHANHVREFSAEARRAVARLADGGIMLVSQSVLLKGVNDNADALAELMRAFVENRIKPYYLHHPDLAPGTAHFRIGIAQGLALVKQLRARLSGLAMPTYMLDIPGGFGKVPLDSDHVEETAIGHRIRDMRGQWHDYIRA